MLASLFCVQTPEFKNLRERFAGQAQGFCVDPPRPYFAPSISAYIIHNSAYIS